MIIKTVFTMAVGGTLCLALSAVAQEHQMSPEDAAMMQAWEQAATPGESHQHLAAMTGTFKATVKWWMDPSAEPGISESTVKRSMALGGRVLEEQWTGSMMEQEFLGHGRTGFDNITKQYWSTWTDNMSTGVMMMHGTRNPEDGSITFIGEYPDPMTGEMIKARAVQTFAADHSETMQMFEVRDNTEVKTMEMTLTRL